MLAKNTLLSQIYYQVKRQFKIKSSEKLNIIVSFVITPLLAWLSALIFRSDMDIVSNDAYPSFLFFMLIAAVFFGLIASVFEIIKDRSMILRERLGGVSGLGYYISKYFVLGVFGLIQTLLYNSVAMVLLYIPWPMALFNTFVMYLTVLISIALGLWVSSMVRSTLVASNLIPALIIPQILLGGIIPYSEMDRAIFMWETDQETIPPVVRIIPVKYAYEAVVTGHIIFVDEEGEINDRISQMVDYLEYDSFMSLEREVVPFFEGCSFCAKTWSVNILILILYTAAIFLAGFTTFYRRFYHG